MGRLPLWWGTENKVKIPALFAESANKDGAPSVNFLEGCLVLSFVDGGFAALAFTAHFLVGLRFDFTMRPWLNFAWWLEAGSAAASRFSGVSFLRGAGLVVLFAGYELTVKRNEFYNILWMLVFGFATLNILALVTRSLDPSGRRRRMAIGEILAVLVVLSCLVLLASEMLNLFHIFPIKLSPR